MRFALVIGIGLCHAAARADGEPPEALRKIIDGAVAAAWRREKIEPAGRAGDTTFLRRLYLDLVGVIPTYDDTLRFLKDPDPRKREKLIDKLLADPRFAVQQTNVWDLVLFGRNPPNGDATRQRDDFKKWLAAQFVKNVPYDRWVRELLLAEQEGTERFYMQFRYAPEDATVAVSRLFLGTQLQCARCHDHPFNPLLTQRDFYGMAGFFVRLVPVDAGKGRYRIAEKSTGEVLFSGSVKEQQPGKKGTPVKPKFLSGAELVEPPVPKGFKQPAFKPNAVPPKPLFSRKEKLAQWLTAPDNPYFAKAVANRVWAQFMGRGLVHPVDDLDGKNPPSHPDLFQVLTKQLLEHKFDLKWFIRELVYSETYQRGDTGPVTAAAPAWFERARVRPLTVEEMIASMLVATDFEKTGLKITGDMMPYMLLYLGEPNDGQGHFQGSLAEHLFLNNAGQIRLLVQPRKGNLADVLLKSKAPWGERVERLFLSVLSRPPRAEERERFVQHLSGDTRAAAERMEEAIWTLLTCAEFRFNH